MLYLKSQTRHQLVGSFLCLGLFSLIAVNHKTWSLSINEPQLLLPKETNTAVLINTWYFFCVYIFLEKPDVKTFSILNMAAMLHLLGPFFGQCYLGGDDLEDEDGGRGGNGLEWGLYLKHFNHFFRFHRKQKLIKRLSCGHTE